MMLLDCVFVSCVQVIESCTSRASMVRRFGARNSLFTFPRDLQRRTSDAPPTDRRTWHCTMCTGACDVLRNSLRWRQMRAPGVVCVSWLLLALQHLSLTPSHLFLNMVGFRSCQHHNFTVVSKSLNVLHYRLYWLKFCSVKLLYSVGNITM